MSDYKIYAHYDAVSIMSAQLMSKVKAGEFKYANVANYLSEVIVSQPTILVGFGVDFQQLRNVENWHVIWVTPYTNGYTSDDANTIYTGVENSVYTDTLDITERITHKQLLYYNQWSISDMLMRINTLDVPEDSTYEYMMLAKYIDNMYVPSTIKDWSVTKWEPLSNFSMYPFKFMKKYTKHFTVAGVPVLLADSRYVDYQTAKTQVTDKEAGILYFEFALTGNSIIKFTFKDEQAMNTVVHFLQQQQFTSFKVTGTTGYGVLPLALTNILSD